MIGFFKILVFITVARNGYYETGVVDIPKDFGCKFQKLENQLKKRSKFILWFQR